MSVKPPLKLGYVLLVVQGLLSALLPRKALAVATTPWRLGFENVGDLQARDWYVELTRVLGVGMLVAGLTGLAIDARRGDDTPDADRAADDDGDGHGGDGDDGGGVDDSGDGPVRVDID